MIAFDNNLRCFKSEDIDKHLFLNANVRINLINLIMAIAH